MFRQKWEEGVMKGLEETAGSDEYVHDLDG